VVLFKGQDEAASMPSFKVGYVKLPVSTAEKLRRSQTGCNHNASNEKKIPQASGLAA